MITVKQYADERRITIQAVHQSMNGKRKKERLEGHVKVIDGVKWLDEEAVAILDEARNKAPIVYEKADANERISELERERDNLLIKVAEQANRIAELSDWKAERAVAIAEADYNKKLLENAELRIDELKQEKAEAVKTVREFYAEQLETKEKLIEEYQAKADAEAKKSKWHRMVEIWRTKE